MKILCNSVLLSNRIGVAQKAVSSKTTMEALKNLVLEASDNTLKIKGYNLESGIITKIDGIDVEKPGKIAVESKLLGEIMKKMPDNILSLEFNEGKLAIKALYQDKKKSLEFNISANGTEDCPAIPEVEEAVKFKLKASVLKDMIGRIRIAFSQDVTKPLLMGGLLEIKDNKIALVALDGYRAVVCKDAIEGTVADSKVIVPGKTLNDVYSLLGSDGDVEIGFDEKFISFSYNDTKIVSQLLEGEYIQYEKLFTNNALTRIKVNRKEFLHAVERATILSSLNQNNVIKLSINDEYTNIVTQSDKGNLSDVIACEKKGQDLDIAFNAKYLIDAAKVITSNELMLEFGDNVKPCIVTPVSEEDERHLILPVRLSK